MNQERRATRLECAWLAVRMAYWMVRRMWQPANLRKKHWLLCEKTFLSRRLLEEAKELDKSLFAFDGEPTPWEEAADVANFAAMLASRAALGAKKMPACDCVPGQFCELHADREENEPETFCPLCDAGVGHCNGPHKGNVGEIPY